MKPLSETHPSLVGKRLVHDDDDNIKEDSMRFEHCEKEGYTMVIEVENVQLHTRDVQKVRDAIYKICILEIGGGQGNLDYRGIKLIQELNL